jgi:hypothetical protein
MQNPCLALAGFIAACGSGRPSPGGPVLDAPGDGLELPDATSGSEPKYLWRSMAWANGHARELEASGSYDPDDPQLELSSGDARKLTIDGAGIAKLDGNRSRIYIHVDHRNIEMVFEANATDRALENISTKLRSRHGEGGDPDNRFGGYGSAFHLRSQLVDFKIEKYHNEHEPGSEYALPRELEYDRWYRYKVSIQSKNDDAIAVIRSYIDYDMNGQWTLVGSEEYERTGARQHDVDAKYTWIRANSGSEVQEGLLLRNVYVAEISAL